MIEFKNKVSLVLAGVILMSFEGTIIRLSGRDSLSFAVVFGVAFGVANLALLLLSKAEIRRSFKAGGLVLWIAGVAMGLSNLSFFTAVKHASIALPVLVLAATPVSCAVISFFWLGKKTGLSVLIATFFVAVGIAIIVGGEIGELSMLGLVASLACLVFYSLLFVIWASFKSVSATATSVIGASLLVILGGVSILTELKCDDKSKLINEGAYEPVLTHNLFEHQTAANNADISKNFGDLNLTKTLSEYSIIKDDLNNSENKHFPPLKLADKDKFNTAFFSGSGKTQTYSEKTSLDSAIKINLSDFYLPIDVATHLGLGSLWEKVAQTGASRLECKDSIKKCSILDKFNANLNETSKSGANTYLNGVKSVGQIDKVVKCDELNLTWQIFGFSRLELGLTIFMGLILTPISRLLLRRGALGLAPAFVGLLLILESVFAPFFGWLFLGEIPPLTTFIGGAIILSAVSLNTLWLSKNRA